MWESRGGACSSRAFWGAAITGVDGTEAVAAWAIGAIVSSTGCPPVSPAGCVIPPEGGWAASATVVSTTATGSAAATGRGTAAAAAEGGNAQNASTAGIAISRTSCRHCDIGCLAPACITPGYSQG